MQCPKTKSIWRQERPYSNVRATQPSVRSFLQKIVAEINEDCKFCTALDPNLIPPLSAKWKVICKNKDVAIPIVTEITIKDYQIFTFLTNSWKMFIALH